MIEWIIRMKFYYNNIKLMVIIYLYDNLVLFDKIWNWIYFINFVKEEYFV